jgi:hypothetical protein
LIQTNGIKKQRDFDRNEGSRLGRSQFAAEAEEVLLEKMFYEIFVIMPKILFHEKSQNF